MNSKWAEIFGLLWAGAIIAIGAMLAAWFFSEKGGDDR